MRFDCQPVDVSFFATAPWRFVNTVELEWSPERVFAVFEDGSSWPKWFGGILNVEWTSPKPFGVGTTRTVKLAPVTVFERFFLWEQGRRFAFDLSAASMPIFRTLAEDYVLEPLPGGRTRFTYTVAIDPGLPLKLTAPIARRNFAKTFREATLGLQRFCK